MHALLEVKNVEKYYGGKSGITKAIDDVSFAVDKGEFIGVMGPSGSGKTTLLNLIATIDKVSAGHIFIDGREITEMTSKQLSSFRRKKLGFVFQDFNLLDVLTVQENIALALTINKADPVSIDQEVMNIALKLGIDDILGKYPNEISGGQRQRVACARAIVTNPALILADEPTGALDSKSAQALLETISDMNKSLGGTILMVTHDAFAASYCSRILVIKDGKIFTEMIRGGQTRKAFFNQILDTLALLGGDLRGVR